MRKEPKKGETWKHFKGTLYEILEIAEHTETGEKIVIYAAKKTEGMGPNTNKRWARPLEMFLELAEENVYRFVHEN